MDDTERGQVAATAAEVYEEFFIPALFGQWPTRVLDAARVETGGRILDIGCGTGILARTAAERVGPNGRVCGLDPNPGMLAVAGRTADRIEWRAGVAETLPFDEASFDHVVSQFAAMFFTERTTAVAEMARVLAPRGSVAVATWGSLDETPGYAAMVELLGDVLGDEAANALRAPYDLGDPDELGRMMATAFPTVAVTRHDGVARFESVDAWVYTDIRGWTLADRIDDDQYARLLDDARSRLSRFTAPDGTVSFPAPALIASARM